ncbi:intracellular multiplication protein IcmT [Thalassospira xiamenensis M-5 = DSM 17429]|uniref:IcmT protein n=1 Tax=Thalassospira xiamenensis M-5 = DSM 17429 TaxID=1123366 RepID=A0AB72UJE6_9PROT|nr:IcmT protein [Thalassospira xiamenensis M-5 = DSM 17429]SIT21921.1 intracellular multiplication protein IcmT [Thalassospira xiamenensis M-5 = DSM 17429]
MHWRYTALTPKLWLLDGRAFFAFTIYGAYWSWETFYTSVTIIVFLSTLSYFGLPIPVAMRLIKRHVFTALSPIKNKKHRPGRPVHLLKGFPR